MESSTKVGLAVAAVALSGAGAWYYLRRGKKPLGVPAPSASLYASSAPTSKPSASAPSSPTSSSSSFSAYMPPSVKTGTVKDTFGLPWSLTARSDGTWSARYIGPTNPTYGDSPALKGRSKKYETLTAAASDGVETILNWTESKRDEAANAKLASAFD